MPIFKCEEIAELWENWCGKTNWSESLRQFGQLGGKIIYYCGMPQSASAIPLTFEMVMPTGEVLPGNSRLKDIKTAIEIASMQIH